MNLWFTFFKPFTSQIDIYFEWTQQDFDRCLALRAAGYEIMRVKLDV